MTMSKPKFTSGDLNVYSSPRDVSDVTRALRATGRRVLLVPTMVLPVVSRWQFNVFYGFHALIYGYLFVMAWRQLQRAEPSRRSALFSREVIATSSDGVAESRSGPRKRALR